MENNKIFGAILLAALVASVTGFILEVIEPHEAVHETAFFVEGVDEGMVEVAEIVMVGIAERMAAADIDRGRRQAGVCQSCHSFDEGGRNGTGPNLWNVVGSDIGAGEGFAYSTTLTSLQGEWDFAALDAFLARPSNYAPGTKMSFAGVRHDQKRADLIMYLRSLSAAPVALPEVAVLEVLEEIIEEAVPVLEENIDVVPFGEILENHEIVE